MKKGLLFRAISFTAQKVVGTFALLRNFFDKIGEAKQATVTRQRQQFEEEKQTSPAISAVTEQQIQKEEQDVFGVKNLVDSLPPKMPQAFYFDKLIETLAALGRTEETFEQGKIYVFKYIAKSKGWYDVFPVAIMVSSTGNNLKGYNYHWERYMNYIQNPYRTYNLDRFESRFYEVKPHELKYVLQIPTFLPIYNH
jgi:hypothetical protein